MNYEALRRSAKRPSQPAAGRSNRGHQSQLDQQQQQQQQHRCGAKGGRLLVAVKDQTLRNSAPGPWSQLQLLAVPSPLESWGGYEAKPEEKVSRAPKGFLQRTASSGPSGCCCPACLSWKPAAQITRSVRRPTAHAGQANVRAASWAPGEVQPDARARCPGPGPASHIVSPAVPGWH